MIRKTGFLVLTILAAGVFSLTSGQTVEPPPVADNATPIDNNIKMRSVELERIKRETQQTAVLRRDDGKELKFSIVKEDFEGIQKEQMLIVEAYTQGNEIDYKQIKQSSDRITEMAVRLMANVFEEETAEKKEEPEVAKLNPFAGKSIRDLIVALDNAIGAVVTSPMWQNLKVIDPAVSVPVEASLTDVIDTSNALWLEAGKKTDK